MFVQRVNITNWSYGRPSKKQLIPQK